MHPGQNGVLKFITLTYSAKYEFFLGTSTCMTFAIKLVQNWDNAKTPLDQY